MVDEICSIDKNEADSAFKLYKKQYIDTLLKSRRFQKYKTNAYVRRNQIDVLEYIDLQKEKTDQELSLSIMVWQHFIFHVNSSIGIIMKDLECSFVKRIYGGILLTIRWQKLALRM